MFVEDWITVSQFEPFDLIRAEVNPEIQDGVCIEETEIAFRCKQI